MSRAITFRFCESASLRFQAEQGLGEVVCSEIRGDLGTMAYREIEGHSQSVQEGQVEFMLDPAAEMKADGFPQIRYAREGVMTFIEIIIPNPSRNDDIQSQPVSERILEKGNSEPVEKPDFLKDDFVEIENVSFEVPELMEFSLSPYMRDAIKALESGEQDFSLTALDNALGIPKALTAPEEDFKFNDIAEMLKKKKQEREKVRVKVKSN